MKIEWKEIKIGGMREALVAIVQGKEIGTICRPARNAAWIVSAGIGANAKHIGNFYSKEGAKHQLVTAPEKYWK